MKNIKLRGRDGYSLQDGLEISFEDGGPRYVRFEDIKDCYKEVLLYIGRKDKNNVEIYEGDIVEIRSSNNDKWKFGGVVDYDNDFNSFCIMGKYGSINLSSKISENIKVIGNEFENEDLIKKEL